MKRSSGRNSQFDGGAKGSLSSGCDISGDGYPIRKCESQHGQELIEEMISQERTIRVPGSDGNCIQL